MKKKDFLDKLGCEDLFEVQAFLAALNDKLLEVGTNKDLIRPKLIPAAAFAIKLRENWHELAHQEQEELKGIFEELIKNIREAESIIGETVLAEQKTSSPPTASSPPSTTQEFKDFIARLSKDLEEGHPGINFHAPEQNSQIKKNIRPIIDYLLKNQHEIAILPPKGMHIPKAITGDKFSAQVLKENGEYVLVISLKTHITLWKAHGGFKKVKEALLFSPKGWSLGVDAVSKVKEVAVKEPAIKTEMEKESEIANDIDSVNIHKPLVGPVYLGKSSRKDEKKRTYTQPKQSLISPKKQSMVELIKHLKKDEGKKPSIFVMPQLPKENLKLNSYFFVKETPIKLYYLSPEAALTPLTICEEDVKKLGNIKIEGEEATYSPQDETQTYSELLAIAKKTGHDYRRSLLPIENLFLIMHTLAEGYTALHRKYIHRDGKPGNYLIDGNSFGSISDFGLTINAAKKNEHSGEAGTHGYFAPEKLKYLQSIINEKDKPCFLEKNKYGLEILQHLEEKKPVSPVNFPSASEDVWSLGRSFQELLAESKLAEDKSLPADIQEIIQELVLLVRDMVVSAQDRPTSAQVLARLNALLQTMLDKQLPCAAEIHAKLAERYKNNEFMKAQIPVAKPKEETKATPAVSTTQNNNIFYVVTDLKGSGRHPGAIWEACYLSYFYANQSDNPISNKFEFYSDLASAQAKMSRNFGAIVAFKGQARPENFQEKNMLWVQMAGNPGKFQKKFLEAGADIKEQAQEYLYKKGVLEKMQQHIETRTFKVNFSRYSINKKRVTKTAKEIYDEITHSLLIADRLNTSYSEKLELLNKVLAGIEKRAMQSVIATEKEGSNKLFNIGKRTYNSALFHIKIAADAKTALDPDAPLSSALSNSPSSASNN